jgi:short-subunit dehydrogenase
MEPKHPLAVITGASSGIGKAFAERLAGDGYDLLIASRTLWELEAVAEILRDKYGVHVTCIAGDLSDPVHRAQLGHKIREMERAEILINNAGFGIDKPFNRVALGNILSMVNTHDVAPVELVHAVLPGMVARQRGTIINVSSLCAFLPGLSRTTYAATKSFLHLFSLGLNLELAPHGIYVQSLCPGFVRTNFLVAQESESLEKKFEHMNFMEPEEVVAASLNSAKKGRALCIPGTSYYVSYLLSRILPLSLFRFISRFRRKEVARETVTVQLAYVKPAA